MTIRWIDLPESLARQLADLPRLVEEGRAEVVKDRPQRTIYRVHLAGHDLHVKQCKVHGWRAWLRERLRKPKAHLEYAKLRAALARQIPAIRPLGYGIGPGESILVTPTVTGAVPLDQWLGISRTPRERFAVAEALGRFMARLHHAGVLHPDPHPGNILIRDTELFLLDLHDARIGRPAGERASIANLVLFNRWFSLRANRSDRLRFWRAYVVERMRLGLGERRGASPTCELVTHPDTSGLRPDARPRGTCRINYIAARDVELATWRSNLRFWRARASRCVGENRRFHRVAIGNLAGYAVRDWSDGNILLDPAALLAGAKVLKDSRSSTVAACQLKIDGVTYSVICKHFRRSPRACRRSWINGHAFIDCLLPTPRPLAMIRRYRFGLPRDGYLITEFIPKAVNLREALANVERRRERIDLVARLVRDLHRRGWSHRDLKAANILLAPNSAGRESAWFIDLAGASRPIRLSRERRAKDLARLNASFHDLPQLSRTDRLRFLRMYLNWNLHGRGDWKSWWRQVDAHTRRKVAKNRRRGQPLA